MCQLILPDEAYYKAYLKCLSDAETDTEQSGPSAIAPSAAYRESAIAPDYPGSSHHPWQQYLREQVRFRNGEDLPGGIVPSTTYWLIDNGHFIGAGFLRHHLNHTLEFAGGHVGYVIAKEYRGMGYGTKLLSLLTDEAAKAGLRSILLTCRSDNAPSKKVIEKNGGIPLDKITRRHNGVWSAINRYLLETPLPIPHYIEKKFRPKISAIETIQGNHMNLVLEGLYGKDINDIVSYVFDMKDTRSGAKLGRISLRAGGDELIYYAGNIGYNVEPAHRGNHLAAKATLMIKELLAAYGVTGRIYITVNPDNLPSRKTCEYLGCTFLELVKLPENNEMYQLGERQKCRYYFTV